MTAESKPLADADSGESHSKRLNPNTNQQSTSRSHLFWVTGRVAWGILLGTGLALLVAQVVVVSKGQTDFCQDYIAAKRLLQGVPVYQTLHCWAGYIPIPTKVEYDTHPPFSALFFFPFGLLPRMPAYTLWGLCCLLCYLLSGYLLLREVGWFSLKGAALFVFGSLCWPALRGAEQFQNLPQLTTLLLVVAWLLERRGYTSWAGGILGLASLLKIWPAVFFLYALIRRRWRFTITGGLFVLLGTALTLPTLGPEAYLTYLGPVRANETPWVLRDSNSSLVGFITRSVHGFSNEPFGVFPPLVGQLSLNRAVVLGEVMAGLLLVGALGFIWWSSRFVKSEPAQLLEYGLLMVVLLLIFPLGWLENLITLLLPCATLILALRHLPRPPGWWFVLLGMSLVPLVADTLWLDYLALWLFQHGPVLAKMTLLSFGLQPFGLFLFAGLQVYLIWRMKKTSTGQPVILPIALQHIGGKRYDQ